MEYNITGHTGLICLLGLPCAHSISPMMHNLAFERLGLDFRYLAFQVGEEALPAAVEGLKALGVRGFNLTMPNKTKMVSLCDRLSPAAKLIGAVNTVVNENGLLTGHNTDGVGYMRSVREAGYEIIGKKMTLLGAGGAATAILVQAALDGVSEISVFLRPESRFSSRAKSLARALMEQTDCKIRLCDFNDRKLLERELSDSAILTNGTSLGMAPDTEGCPVPEEIFAGLGGIPAGSRTSRPLVVSDIIYNPAETKLLRLARENGLSAFNGHHMLLYQGAEAFRLWTGREMPVEEVLRQCF